MTAKKFTLIEFLPNVIRIEDMGRKLEGQEIVDLLNRLFDENEQLKSDLIICHSYLSSKTSVEEVNEELRKQNKKLKEELEWCRMTIDGLKGDVE